VDVGIYAADGPIVGHDAVYPVGFGGSIEAGASAPFTVRLYDPDQRIASGFRVEALAEARLPSSAGSFAESQPSRNRSAAPAAPG
jgi:hypothetical protein